MPRLRSKSSGVVISVSDEVAGLIGHSYEPVAESKKPSRRSTKADEDK